MLSVRVSAIGTNTHALPMAKALVGHWAAPGLLSPQGERPSWVGEKRSHHFPTGAVQEESHSVSLLNLGRGPITAGETEAQSGVGT